MTTTSGQACRNFPVLSNWITGCEPRLNTQTLSSLSTAAPERSPKFHPFGSLGPIFHNMQRELRSRLRIRHRLAPLPKRAGSIGRVSPSCERGYIPYRRKVNDAVPYASDGFRQGTTLVFAITGNLDRVSRIFAVSAAVLLALLDGTHASGMRTLFLLLFRPWYFSSRVIRAIRVPWFPHSLPALFDKDFVTDFLENAERIFETAASATVAEPESGNLAIVIGQGAATGILIGSDWPLDSLRAHHGAESRLSCQPARLSSARRRRVPDGSLSSAVRDQFHRWPGVS